jgi:hypothetical protein
MDPAELEGKRIALVLTDERDESVAFTGTAHWDGDRLVMLRNKPDPPVQIHEEWHHKIRATPDDSKNTLLGAEFFLMLSVGNLPAGVGKSEFQKTGLKWPEG